MKKAVLHKLLPQLVVLIVIVIIILIVSSCTISRSISLSTKKTDTQNNIAAARYLQQTLNSQIEVDVDEDGFPEILAVRQAIILTVMADDSILLENLLTERINQIPQTPRSKWRFIIISNKEHFIDIVTKDNPTIDNTQSTATIILPLPNKKTVEAKLTKYCLGKC